MKKSEFITNVVSTLEGLQIDLLGECYDITSEVHDMVDRITENNEIVWDLESDIESDK